MRTCLDESDIMYAHCPEAMDLLLLDEQNEEDILLLMATEPPPKKVQRVDPHFDINAIDDDKFLEDFSFQKDDIERLANALSLPNMIQCEQRTKASKLEAMCIVLRRLSYPNRLKDLSPQFRRSVPELSYIIKATIRLIHDRHIHLLSNLRRLNETDFEKYAMAIKTMGGVDKCWGFIGETALQIRRLVSPQRQVFSGHKKFALKFQAVMAPDGIIVHMFGPLEGKEFGLLERSGLYTELHDIFSGKEKHLFLYGGQEYNSRPLLKSPFKSAMLSEEQQQHNKAMSIVRKCVQWGFGKILQNFAFLDFEKNQKLYVQPVGKYYKVAALLTNCHTCLYGSKTSTYFSLEPPELEHYLAQ